MGTDITDADPEIMESFKYLVNTTEERIKYQSMPFDGKVQCWIEDHKDGFLAAEIQETKGDDVTVKTSKGESVTLKKDKIMDMNPPKYYQCEDMADLTYLNEATVFYNLSARYLAWKIYTYSGLFCITINPFKRLPVYTFKIMNVFRGKKRNEVPPHLYSIADTAYQNMLRDRENQSMLITGESGAGKTENTKKVIQYLANVAAADKPKTAGESDKPVVSLEDQIVAANPVLEAYGNAKTVRNNNSSRFGKFIRIHFGPSGKIAGADIESYLLEKSRIVYQQPVERNYHIFYQLLAKNYPKYHAELLVQPEPGLYFYINQGMLAIDRVDDGEEMKATDEAFDTLEFAQQDKLDLFKATGAILHWGNAQWKQKPKEEQAECDGTEECEKVAHLLGVDAADFIKGLLKPRIKVGNEYVNKGQNKEQVTNSCGALSKSMFDRMFRWLVDSVNKTLDAKTKRQYFIGVLDIAGFEIFDFNTFEQLCINYTNERLQQFFNHHMFVLEQEEYKKEGIKWEMMNFGMDLQACIDLIEKPMGILSILEEECIVPKASDKTYVDKLYATHLGKHPAFGKPKPQKGKQEAHFELHHYAGTVAYNIWDWLNKNKDPINVTVATLMKNSKNNALLRLVFSEVGEEEDKKSGGGGGGKGGKKGPQTLSATHREQLNKLMNTLKATSPHFVRCIIPNEIKTGGILDSHLVMHQLTCNGVLEGIRICRKGFPNRMVYQEFKQRYSILAPNVIPKGFVDATKASGDILKEIKLDEQLYRLGNTKVFFKAGVLGQLEEYRDEALGKIISKFQANIRSFVVKKLYKTMLEQKLATSVLQRNVRKYLDLKNWHWFRLLAKIKPLLSNSRSEEEAKAKEEEMKKQMEKLAQDAALTADLQSKVAKLEAEKKDLLRDLEAERDAAGSVGERVQTLVIQKSELETQLKELEQSLNASESSGADLESKKRALEANIDNLSKEKEAFQIKILKQEAESRQKDLQLKQNSDEISRLDEALVKITRDKKKSDESNARLSEELQSEIDKVNSLSKIKIKLEQTIDEAEENLEREKKLKSDSEKAKRKLESELKTTQASNDELYRVKHELEELVKRKDHENNSLSSKIDEDQTLLNAIGRKNKELSETILRLEDELELERQTRVKLEKQRSDLVHELDDLNERLEEAGGATSAQHDLNKRREAELQKFRHDLEQANVFHEETVTQIRKKHQEAVQEMAEQMDQLQKAKNRVEKEKLALKSELESQQTIKENTNKAKLNAEKVLKQLEQQVNDVQAKLEEVCMNNNELKTQKSRLQSENSELVRQIEELEAQINSFNKMKQQLNSQIEASKRAEEEEMRTKGSLIQQLRNLSSDFEAIKEQFEESEQAKNDLFKALTKANHEAQHWRNKYENEGRASADELEEAKRKLAVKLLEAEEQLETALVKCNNLEKTKQRLQNEVEDLAVDVEKANANSSSLERKQKQFEKLIGEWKKKCEDITAELVASQKEARNYANEMYRLRTECNETNELNEALKRDNKSLSDEVRELLDQIGSDGKNYLELEKSRKRIEIEKEEMQVCLEAAEVALQSEMAKVNKLQTQIAQSRNDVDKKIAEKEEEFEATRRNHAFSLESIQTSLEGETRAKHEIMKAKKKIEMDLSEFEVKYDLLKRTQSELQKQNRKLQQDNLELQTQIDNLKGNMDEMNDELSQSERKYSMVAHELDETRLLLDQSERAKKNVESELHEAADKISELSTQYSSVSVVKRKLENDLNTLQNDLSDAQNDLKNSDERLRKTLVDQLRLEDELKIEREHLLRSDSLRKELESQLKDFQTRLNEAEVNALKGGKRVIQKLEQRIHELESQLEYEHKHHQETLKEMKKNDKRIKDLIVQSEEDRRHQCKLQEVVEALQHKLKVYKRQTEEAEELASSNLAKYRKLQAELDNAHERVEGTETQFTRLRGRNRNQLIQSSNGPGDDQRTLSIAHQQRQTSVLRNQ